MQLITIIQAEIQDQAVMEIIIKAQVKIIILHQVLVIIIKDQMVNLGMAIKIIIKGIRLTIREMEVIHERIIKLIIIKIVNFMINMLPFYQDL